MLNTRNVQCKHTHTYNNNNNNTCIIAALFYLSLYLPLPLFLNRMSNSYQKLIQCFYQFTTRMTFHSVCSFSSVCQTAQNKSITTLIIWHLVFFQLIFSFSLAIGTIFFFIPTHYHYFCPAVTGYWLYIRYIFYFSIFLPRSIGFLCAR